MLITLQSPLGRIQGFNLASWVWVSSCNHLVATLRVQVSFPSVVHLAITLGKIQGFDFGAQVRVGSYIHLVALSSGQIKCATMDSRLLIIIFGISISSCELSRLNEVAIAKCAHRICNHQGCCV